MERALDTWNHLVGGVAGKHCQLTAGTLLETIFAGQRHPSLEPEFRNEFYRQAAELRIERPDLPPLPESGPDPKEDLESRLRRWCIEAQLVWEMPVDEDEYRPASWFGQKLSDRLRKAAQPDRRTKKVRSKCCDGVTMYNVEDARKWWPGDIPESPTGA
jgi:hypothetical protein